MASFAGRAAVITQAELDAIRALATRSPPALPLDQQRALQRQQADEASLKLAGTLKAARAAKEQARQQRITDAEAALRQADREAKGAAAEERRAAVAVASRKLFLRSTSVQGLRSAAQLSDALAERQVQIAADEHAQKLQREADARFTARQRTADRVAEQEARRRSADAHAASLHQRDVQLAQIEELNDRILADRARNRAEGASIRADAQKEAAQDAAREASRRQSAARSDAETAAANAVLLGRRAEEVVRDRERDAAIERYAARKTAVEEERSRADAARAAAKEAHRQRMVAVMEAKYLEAASRSESRLDAEVQEEEDTAAEVAAARARARLQEWREIDRSRQLQLAQRKAAREAELVGERAAAAALAESLVALKEEEARRARRALDANRAHVAFLDHQVARRAAAQLDAKQEHMQEANLRLYGVDEADGRFKAYAQACIEEQAARGRDTKPMQLYIAATQHRALAA